MDTRRIAGVAARVLGVALIALVVVLTLQVRHLWGIAGQFDDFRSYPHEGQWVPAAAFETLAGDTVVLGDADSASTEILFTLTAACPYSLASLNAWREIQTQLERVQSGAVAVYFLSLSDRDSTAQFAAEHGIPPNRMLLGSDKRMLRIYRIGGGPLTLVIGPGGRVEHARPHTLLLGAALDSVVHAATSLMSSSESIEPSAAADSAESVAVLGGRTVHSTRRRHS